MIIDLHKASWQWATLLLLATIWGSSFILMKYGLESYSYTQVAAWRLFVAFAVLSPVSFRHLRKLRSHDWYWFVIVGAIGNGIPAFMFTLAQTQVESSFAGMLNSLTPLFTLLLGIVAFGFKSKARAIAGILVGLAGALVLIVSDGLAGPGGQWTYTLYIVLATLCYATSVNVLKKFLNGYNSMVISALAFTTVGPFTGIWLLSTDFTDRVASGTPALVNLGYITLLGVVGTALAIILFNHLLKYSSMLFAASVTYLIPLVAVFWGVIAGETVAWTELLGMGIVLAGVWMVNSTGKTSS